jgi:hypothetical protein
VAPGGAWLAQAAGLVVFALCEVACFLVDLVVFDLLAAAVGAALSAASFFAVAGGVADVAGVAAAGGAADGLVWAVAASAAAEAMTATISFFMVECPWVAVES